MSIELDELTLDGRWTTVKEAYLESNPFIYVYPTFLRFMSI